MATNTSHNVLFTETQRFRQVWLWVLLLAVSGLFMFGFVWQVVLGHPFGNRPIPDVMLGITTLLVSIGFPLLFYSFRLCTKVYDTFLTVRFYPFHLAPVRIPFQKIKLAESVIYNPLLDYGGWGIRWGLKGKAYNISGNKGVKLYFFHEKPLLIGTRKPDQLLAAIEKGLRLRDEQLNKL